MNHFQHTVGAPLYGTEAFPTQQSQIQRFMKEVCVCVCWSIRNQMCFPALQP